jgi:hypothetical protein
MNDPILEQSWRIREELFQQYGGADGLFAHLQAMDRTRARKAKQRQRRQKKTVAGKTSDGRTNVARAASRVRT